MKKLIQTYFLILSIFTVTCNSVYAIEANNACEVKIISEGKVAAEYEILKKALESINPNWQADDENFSLLSTTNGLNLYLKGSKLNDLTPLQNFSFDTVWLIDANFKDVSFLQNSQNLRVLIVINSNKENSVLDCSYVPIKKLQKVSFKNIKLKNIDSLKNSKLLQDFKIENEK